MANYQSPQDKFDAVDTSGDGLVDLAELQAKAVEKASNAFNALDADASGDLNLEEFTANRGTRKSTRRAIKTCIDELTATEGF